MIIFLQNMYIFIFFCIIINHNHVSQRLMVISDTGLYQI